ncbi:MAG: hypothetical protein IPM61_11650 [Chlorobi bacterium]|nr:hypothetical protein [Chlorobiota bacterium]MBX7215392.1 hypothetical protein [Candidatus Kapabacteria bacterium]
MTQQTRQTHTLARRNGRAEPIMATRSTPALKEDAITTHPAEIKPTLIEAIATVRQTLTNRRRISVKATLICFILIIAICPVNAQKKSPPLFLGIPWNAGVDEVRKVLDSVEKIQFKENRHGKDENGNNDTNISVLEYSGGQYAGFSAERWIVGFFKNRIYYINVKYDLEGAQAIDRWENLRELLKTKYGNPKPDSFKWLTILREIRDNDQEIWDEDLSSDAYLYSYWDYKSKNISITINCKTGNNIRGVEISFMNLTVMNAKDKFKKEERLKDM